MTHTARTIIAPERHSRRAIEIPVLRVVDGDGFLTRMRVCDFTRRFWNRRTVEIPIRFGFIDAPEMKQPGGPEAKAFLKSLIDNRTVWVDVLTKSDTGKSTDHYGRVVAVPYVEEQYEQGVLLTGSKQRHWAQKFDTPVIMSRNIELEMVLNGWAWVLTKYGPHDGYLAALEDARAHHRGIWANDTNTHPGVYKHWQRQRAAREAERVSLRVVEPCPEPGCGGNLVTRHARHGTFVGCSNFPRCRYTKC